MTQPPIIDWQYPQPGSAWDRFIGPGATRAEVLLQVVPPLVAAAALPLIAIGQGWGWTWWQHLAASLLMLDMLGGIITNATSTAKRWYHREGQGFREHMGFIGLHIFQPLLLVLVFDRGNLAFVIGSFGYLLATSLTILAAPLYLRRPLAMLAMVGGIGLGLYVLPVPMHFAWFLPLYYAKLLVSHLLREEPYRPDVSGADRAE